MAPIQSKIVAGTGVTQNAMSFDTLPVVGRRVVVYYGIWDPSEAPTVTCSDNQGHTYNTLWRVTPTGGFAGYGCFDVVTTASSGTFTITVASDGTTVDISTCIIEMPGADREDYNYDTLEESGLSISHSRTTTNASTELLGVMVHGWFANPANVTESGGFTLLREVTNNSSAVGLYIATRTVTSTGTYTCTWTWDDAGTHYGANAMNTYYGSVSGGVTLQDRHAGRGIERGIARGVA